MIPFVKHSKFYGAMINEQTLSLYFNVTDLNRELQLSGHGTLADWNKFRDVYNDQLAVLPDFHFTPRKPETFNSTTGILLCTAPRRGIVGPKSFKIKTAICVHVAALHSVR